MRLFIALLIFIGFSGHALAVRDLASVNADEIRAKITRLKASVKKGNRIDPKVLRKISELENRLVESQAAQGGQPASR